LHGLSIDDAVCEELFQLSYFGAPDSPAGSISATFYRILRF
jgi:hypothetical protein